ncbi:MAG: hypothetical protein ABIP95_08235, partial [Pelobium sp.]
MHRRKFIHHTGAAVAATLLSDSLLANTLQLPKKKIAMVGTGHRGTSMWGTEVINEYADTIEFVGLCDKNPGRVKTALKMMKL